MSKTILEQLEDVLPKKAPVPDSKKESDDYTFGDGFNYYRQEVIACLPKMLEVIRKRVAENQKGQFIDDAGYICWDLVKLLDLLK